MERSWLPWKIRILSSNTTGRRDKSLSAIALKYWRRYKDESESAPNTKCCRYKDKTESATFFKNPRSLCVALGYCLNGKRNTPHLVAILEEEFKLPIAELRELVREDRERKAAGKPIDRWEASDWNIIRKSRLAGMTEEEIQISLARYRSIRSMR